MALKEEEWKRQGPSPTIIGHAWKQKLSDDFVASGLAAYTQNEFFIG